MNKKLALPIGVSDYKELTTGGYYYVDKSLLIKDLLDNKAKVTLITRPRRFGKTLNLSMVRTFFEKTDTPPDLFFKNTKIWNIDDGYYRKYSGKYPVIYLTFKDTKSLSWEECLMKIKELLSDEFGRHLELLKSEKCNKKERESFDVIWKGEENKAEAEKSLKLLTSMLYTHYRVKPIVLVDEYDVPIDSGHKSGYFNDVTSFVGNLFSSVFKDNEYLNFGLITGCLKIAKESIITGLNNLDVCTILDNAYTEYFGFTEEEVRSLLRTYNNEEKIDEVKSWYDGYNFSGNEIYNPWSLINLY